jgi:hypothetical protein
MCCANVYEWDDVKATANEEKPLGRNVFDVRARIDGEAEVCLHLLRDDAQDCDPFVDRDRRVLATVALLFRSGSIPVELSIHCYPRVKTETVPERLPP